MSHGGKDVSTSLIEELDGLSSSTARQCIDRVNDKFRSVNRKAYEPELVAIGPYHHHSKNLGMMEEYKKRYARESEDHLTTMMVLDGCFIIELLKRFDDPSLREEGDRIFRLNWMLTSLQRDLLLFENQLPFIVLCKLHDLVVGENCHELLVREAMLFFKGILPGKGHRIYVSGDLKDSYIHLLDLEFIRRATELQEAGIKIEKGEGKLFDIVFENKTLKIPPLTIEDRTDSILRNLIAHEQYDEYYPHLSFVSDYVKFLDCLIDYPEDVEILRQNGIIVNWKSNDKGVSTMFNDIYESVVGPSMKDFCYISTFNNTNQHCNQRKNRWMASLRRTYFSNPWAIISLCAAISLLILSVLQTIFTILGYFKQ
ncbi:hypothetical protein LguiA_002022 [Lonicera macranthoides]